MPQYFRVVRNATVAAREEPYIEAARALGASPGVIMRRYLFGNVVQTVPVIATLNAGDAILTLAGLGFLGFGIEPTSGADWGYDLNKALSDTAAGIWWTGVFPGLAIVLIVVGRHAGRREPQRRAEPVAAHLEAAAGRAAQAAGGRQVSLDVTPSAPPTGTVLEVDDLRVWYAGPGGPVRAVDGVSFSLAPGEVLGLVGESGCGKSTLGRGLMGLLPRGAAVDGTLRFDGQDILALPTKERERLRGAGMGLIFQEPMTRLDPLMKISDHFDEELKAHEPDLARPSDAPEGWMRCARWESRRPATRTTRTSSPAACANAS